MDGQIAGSPKVPAYLAAQVWVCPSPYNALKPISLTARQSEPPPLGSVVYASGQSVLAALEYLALAIERWPWVAPCIGLPPSEYSARERADLVVRFGERLANVLAPAGAAAPSPATIAAAVAQRKAPSARVMAEWVATRLQLPEIAVPLLEQFSYAPGESSSKLPRSKATYSRSFSHAGSLTAHDWRAIGRLAGHLATRKNPRVAQHPARLFARTASRHVKRYLGMGWAEASALVGWEWVLERVLQEANRIP